MVHNIQPVSIATKMICLLLFLIYLSASVVYFIMKSQPELFSPHNNFILDNV